MARGKYKETGIPRMTDNRIKIMRYCLEHENTITKAQTMLLFSHSKFPEESAYSTLKGMVNHNILKKIKKGTYLLIQKDM